MLYHREGFPEEEEIVLCKVTKIFPNSVFVDLLEYDRSGLIHISEIAPGRIRNLREFVSIDRQIVCKVLRIDKEKGYIDLSLRRVNSRERNGKLEDIKQELKAEQLVKNVATKLKTSPEKLYAEISRTVFKKYPFLHLCFKEVAEGTAKLASFGLPEALAKEITAAVIEKFKPAKVAVKGEMRLQTYLPQGIEKIKNCLSSVRQITPALQITYLGAGRYRFLIEEKDYKFAEKHLLRIQEILEQFIDKLSTASLEREKGE